MAHIFLYPSDSHAIFPGPGATSLHPALAAPSSLQPPSPRRSLFVYANAGIKGMCMYRFPSIRHSDYRCIHDYMCVRIIYIYIHVNTIVIGDVESDIPIVWCYCIGRPDCWAANCARRKLSESGAHTCLNYFFDVYTGTHTQTKISSYIYI